MIDRGSGPTSGLTDWRLMDLLSMWACIRDQDPAGHWKQVAGWRKICELAQAHLGRLKEYRRGLAEAWPPATNAAARAYLGELDGLIDKVQRTHDAASANYDALAAATRAISSARVKLKPLHDEYVDKLQQKRTFEATLADPKAAMGSRVPDKPVTDADLEKINSRARTVMYGISSELQQAQAMLRLPPTPPKTPKQLEDPDVYGSHPPVIASITPTPLAAASGVTPRNSSAIRSQIPNSVRRGIGPSLGAISTTQTPSLVRSTPPGGGGLATPVTTPAEIGLPPGSLIGGSRPTRNQGSPPTDMKPHFSARQDPITGPPSRPSSPLPVGGMIGGLPGTGVSQPGGTPPPRKASPVSGIIGGGGAGIPPTGATGFRSNAKHRSQPGNLHGTFSISGSTLEDLPDRQGSRQGIETKWDPEQPWKTKEGVSPTIESKELEVPTYPGPTIGIDR